MTDPQSDTAELRRQKEREAQLLVDLAGEKEWWLVCTYRFGSEFELAIEESAEVGNCAVRVRVATAMGTVELTEQIRFNDLKAALELLEARQQ